MPRPMHSDQEATSVSSNPEGGFMKRAAISIFVALAAGSAQAQTVDNGVPVQAVQATAEP